MHLGISCRVTLASFSLISSFVLLVSEVSLRQMDELSPHCPSGVVSFCQTFTPVQWSSFSQFLETGEALDDYAKFRSSLMGTYASLTMSIASDNKVIFTVLCLFFPVGNCRIGLTEDVFLMFINVNPTSPMYIESLAHTQQVIKGNKTLGLYWD